MFKILTLIILTLAVYGGRGDTSTTTEKLTSNDDRQKRLLFYDGQGNLVNTNNNPYLRDLAQCIERMPFFGNYLNPFLNFFRPSTYGAATFYMVPVSQEVSHQISTDPVYQNKLVYLPTNEVVITGNPLCSGKRIQIPSPTFCNNFLNCWDGWAFEQECPTGLLFSSAGYCDYPHKVDCSNRRLRENPQPLCNKDFEAFRNQLSCNEFFICVNRVPIRFKCPADLFFNQELGVCDYSNRVLCNASLAIARPMPVLSPITSAPSAASQPILIAPGKDVNSVLTNSIVNSQSWTSMQVATSRQDAIRQLQLGRIAKVNSA